MAKLKSLKPLIIVLKSQKKKAYLQNKYLVLPPKQLEEIIYFVSWVVTDPGDLSEAKNGIKYKQVLSEREYRALIAQYGPGSFTAQTGAEAIKVLLEQIDLEKDYKEIK